MKKEWNVVDILRYARHDWLNKLQLIKGNIALNRLDRANEIIEEIIIEAKHESSLTNTKMNLFAGYIMTYHWNSLPLRLEVEVLGEARDLSHYDKELYEWLSSFVHVLEETSDYTEENHLSISLFFDQSSVRFFFDFSGILTDSSDVEKWLMKYGYNQRLQVISQEVTTNEASVVIELNEE
ncbi:Spo0B C-terminal domain-containing protein [Priestia iocasae]|uniref:Stage 0 sporulation protein B (Sporulation initiation phosphotransferase) n=1 Tax=Priestia iocasae TaxID=2291674 RepID=A0ABS2QPK8_9BACI|nr:Spo0B C-terminal domain-containing protein [Metabacillus iocasae]MBM7701376.1 stage 0 sporulation protein B (sporulation initiation phosphotransferase) [Metabacillus iocasae]